MKEAETFTLKGFGSRSHSCTNERLNHVQANESIFGLLSKTFINYLGKPAAVPLSFVEIENKEISDGISSYDLYEYCQNTSEALRWDL